MRASNWNGFKDCIVEWSDTRTVPRVADGTQYPTIVKMLLARPNIAINTQNKVIILLQYR